MDKIVTCINCPLGCRITVTLSEKGKFDSVSGNTCPRGAVYAEQECTRPMRMITAVIHVSGSAVPLSVKTNLPVPKSLIPEMMGIIGRLNISAPVRQGETILKNILNTGADIIATRTV